MRIGFLRLGCEVEGVIARTRGGGGGRISICAVLQATLVELLEFACINSAILILVGTFESRSNHVKPGSTACTTTWTA